MRYQDILNEHETSRVSVDSMLNRSRVAERKRIAIERKNLEQLIGKYHKKLYTKYGIDDAVLIKFHTELKHAIGHDRLYVNHLLDRAIPMLYEDKVDDRELDKIYNRYNFKEEELSMMSEYNPLMTMILEVERYNFTKPMINFIHQDDYEIFFKAMYLSDMKSKSLDNTMMAQLLREVLECDTLDELNVRMALYIEMNINPKTFDVDKYLPNMCNLDRLRDIVLEVAIDNYTYPYGQFTGLQVKSKVKSMFTQYMRLIEGS